VTGMRWQTWSVITLKRSCVPLALWYARQAAAAELSSSTDRGSRGWGAISGRVTSLADFADDWSQAFKLR
jgi:hypothetical protein